MGVFLLTQTQLKDNTIEVKRCNKIMAIKVVVWKGVVNVVYAYTHVKLEESKKKSF